MISLLFMVALRDSVRGQVKIVAVVWKNFVTTIKLHLGVRSLNSILIGVAERPVF